MRNMLLAGVVMAIAGLTGCASIVGDKSQTVQINSHPHGAHFEIKDEAGNIVTRGTTPETVSLEKSTGHYFGGKDYKITFTKDGYSPTDVVLTHHVNGWYAGGNLVFGGLIGYLAVDPFNGGMYTLKPEKADASLVAVKNTARL